MPSTHFPSLNPQHRNMPSMRCLSLLNHEIRFQPWATGVENEACSAGRRHAVLRPTTGTQCHSTDNSASAIWYSNRRSTRGTPCTSARIGVQQRVGDVCSLGPGADEGEQCHNVPHLIVEDRRGDEVEHKQPVESTGSGFNMRT